LITPKIRLNRITIFIMNLWAKRIGQLAALPVALFFFSCEDEASKLGYKNPNTKFEARYVEIPVESSVLLLDSQRTSNFVFQNETNRLLVGQYFDEDFGTVTAAAYTQFFTNNTNKLPAGAVYDSVSLRLQFDFYSYGSRDSTTAQNVSVYELTEDLAYGSRRNYFNRSQAAYNPLPLGSKSFLVNPSKMEEIAIEDPDSVLSVRVPLDPSFGQRIFDKALDYASDADSTYINYSLFTQIFKGIAITSDNGDKVIGVTPFSTIRVHYHKDTIASTLDLGFVVVANFSQIKSDLSGTSLSGLTQYSQDFSPPDNLRYIQSGTGIYTKLDLGKFFEFCDTVPNVIITSAQLSVDAVEESNFAPPSSLLLKILNGATNFTEKYSRNNEQDNRDLVLYNPSFPAHTGSLRFDVGTVNEVDSAFYAEGDLTPNITYSSSTKSFRGNYPLFFQQLASAAEGKRRFQHFLLSPSSPSFPNTKSVNRVVFPKDNIKLKIHYTKPTTPLN
jgi:hypothetical protein